LLAPELLAELPPSLPEPPRPLPLPEEAFVVGEPEFEPHAHAENSSATPRYDWARLAGRKNLQLV